jgi:hypothetical protein
MYGPLLTLPIISAPEAFINNHLNAQKTKLQLQATSRAILAKPQKRLQA